MTNLTTVTMRGSKKGSTSTFVLVDGTWKQAIAYTSASGKQVAYLRKLTDKKLAEVIARHERNMSKAAEAAEAEATA